MESPFKIISNGDVSTGPSESPSKTQTRVSLTIKYSKADIDDIGDRAERSVSIDELYSEREALSIAFNTALSLFQEGIVLAEEAKKHMKEEDYFAADDAIVRLHGLMPEMFACRDIGDGYGAIIGALMFSLENKQGDPLDEHQINVLLRVLRKTRSSPFMAFDASVDLIMMLDDVGFVTEPREFKHYAAWLDEGEEHE